MQTPSRGQPAPVAPEALRDAAPITHCQLCGSAERDRKFADPPFEVVTCRQCGLVYVTPRLQGQALLDVYGEGYWKSDNPKVRGYADYAREAALYLKTFQRRLALVRHWLPDRARVLDVGCAAGYFLRVLAPLGHDVHGVELSPAIAGEAIAALGKERIHIGTLDDAVAAMDYQSASFDLITLWDVIEHVPEPQAVLRRIRELLRPTGHLLLETQNVASRWARLLGRRWHHYKHHEHLYHFDPATITRLLADCGFAVERIGADYAGKYVSFAFLAERAGRLGRIPGLLAKPLQLLRGCSVYVNPRDEIIVAARPR
ncbi:MAG: class I SAM-dependent methyltransferase [Planctomycetes bacterium]|nr:class I SAM-dependent methyltransferase [Planctomycetota bacterium]